MRSLRRHLDAALLAMLELMAFYCDEPRPMATEKISYFTSCCARIILTAEETGIITSDDYCVIMKAIWNMGMPYEYRD